MSDLKQELIRLGSVRKDLRPHIRPLLEKMQTRTAGLKHWDQWEQVRDMLGPEEALINVMGYAGDNKVRDQFEYMARMWDIPVEVTRRSRPGDLIDDFEPYFRNMEKLADEFVQGMEDRLIGGAIKDIARHYDIRVSSRTAYIEDARDANEVLALVGKKCDAAIKDFKRMGDRSTAREIERAWDQWKVTKLADMGIIGRRLRDLADEALAYLDNL